MWQKPKHPGQAPTSPASPVRASVASVQGLRSDAEAGLADSVMRANEAMQRIAQINQQVSREQPGDATTANLLDQRDRYVDELAQLMDIKVVPTDRNQITVFTNSGAQL